MIIVDDGDDDNKTDDISQGSDSNNDCPVNLINESSPLF